MICISIIPRSDGVPDTIRCLRKHTELPVGEIRARLLDGRSIVDLPFDGDASADVRRCRSLLRDLDAVGATIRAWDTVDGRPDEELPRAYLRNWMRTVIGIARGTRADMDREAERDDERRGG
jgi:hypothetical protein